MYCMLTPEPVSLGISRTHCKRCRQRSCCYIGPLGGTLTSLSSRAAMDPARRSSKLGGAVTPSDAAICAARAIAVAAPGSSLDGFAGLAVALAASPPLVPLLHASPPGPAPVLLPAPAALDAPAGCLVSAPAAAVSPSLADAPAASFAPPPPPLLLLLLPEASALPDPAAAPSPAAALASSASRASRLARDASFLFFGMGNGNGSAEGAVNERVEMGRGD